MLFRLAIVVKRLFGGGLQPDRIYLSFYRISVEKEDIPYIGIISASPKIRDIAGLLLRGRDIFLRIVYFRSIVSVIDPGV